MDSSRLAQRCTEAVKAGPCPVLDLGAEPHRTLRRILQNEEAPLLRLAHCGAGFCQVLPVSTEIIRQFFQFINMVKYVDRCLNVKPTLHSWVKPHLVLMYVLHIVFDLLDICLECLHLCSYRNIHTFSVAQSTVSVSVFERDGCSVSVS